jgi:hypothetical protein
MGTRMAWWWWYLIFMTIDFIRAQNPFGGDFAGDPFLELTAGVTTPVNQKFSNSNSSCVSNGALAGAIIGTLLLSAFAAFLIWMIYLRQKLQGWFDCFVNLYTDFFENNQLYSNFDRTSII